MKNNIKEVLLIFKTHLDIGFTNYAHYITRKYIEEYIPTAIRVGYELKDTKTPFVWTVGSWLVHMALKEDGGVLEKAIHDGVVSWHGLPFTTHTELMSPKLFEYGISISKNLDKRFERKTISAKLTDVPGHTIGMVPIMAKSGIKFLHIGVNPATPLPEVPNRFVWKCGEESIIVMYEDDYGVAEEFDDFAIVFAHTGDNKGPQNAEQIINEYKKVSELYPDAVIRAASLDDVAERMCKIKGLPVIEDEIGDTWIHGAGTDPKKVSKYRSLMRYIDENNIENYDFSENLLLVPEHTWGMDIKKFFPDTEHFYDTDFTGIEKERECVEKSWIEQRSYVEKAEKLLGVNMEYDISYPDLSDYEEVDRKERTFSISWQLFDNSDYERYKQKYVKISDSWAIWDFTKVGLPDYNGGIFEATVDKVYKKDASKITLMSFPENISKKYGLPGICVIEENNMITVKWFGKSALRLPQAYWFKLSGFDEKWKLNKMGKWIEPEKIIGSPLITAVYEGVKNEEFCIKSLDAPLVAPFGRHLLDYNLEKEKQNLYFCLYNNIWNTNFPMWYSEDAVFRFKIEEMKDETSEKIRKS